MVHGPYLTAVVRRLVSLLASHAQSRQASNNASFFFLADPSYFKGGNVASMSSDPYEQPAQLVARSCIGRHHPDQRHQNIASLPPYIYA